MQLHFAPPEPALRDWLRMIYVKGRLPSNRGRRRRWRAVWQFERVAAQLSPGDIAIDCGASDGGCTRRLAANGATVYAFEPDPHGMKGLRDQFLNMPNVWLLEQAVGIEDSSVELHRVEHFDENPDHFVASSSLFHSIRRGNGTSVPVRQIDFPAFLAALPHRVAILKMDIEGAEVPILEHLLELRPHRQGRLCHRRDA